MSAYEAVMMGEANRGNELMVFDWDKAAKIIKEKSVNNASAGLSGDWEYTGGDILIEGCIPEDSYTYLASTWAIPKLQIDGHFIDCYKMISDTDGWGADTFWPESAKAIAEI